MGSSRGQDGNMKKIRLRESQIASLTRFIREREEGGTSQINESSISRMWKHISEHDSAIISAFRDADVNCRNGENTGKKYTYKENMARNKELKAALMKLGYGLTTVGGNYIENYKTPEAVEVREQSFYVVNTSDYPKFIQNIANLGEYYCQDTVLIIPQGGENAYLLGTNDDEWVGYGEKMRVGDFTAGDVAEFLTRVGGRPVAFQDRKPDEKGLKDSTKDKDWSWQDREMRPTDDEDLGGLDEYATKSIQQKHAISTISKRVLDEISSR